MSESRFWCFTLNNYGEGEFEDIKKWKASYIVLGREKGENGTPHIQGYIEYEKKKKFSALQKLNTRIHWERRKGTGEQASDYCKKEGDYYERGTLAKGRGARNDLDFIGREMEKGSTIRKVLGERDCNLQQIRTAEKYLTYLERKREWKPQVIWLWGASGAGKSRRAYELAQGTDTYEKDGEKWWDGYDAHETVIIDDFRASNMKFNYLLKLLDRYPLRVEFKGGYRQMLAKKIIITSILHPQNVYQIDDEPIKQLIRRIDEIIQVKLINDFAVDSSEVAKREQVGGNTRPRLVRQSITSPMTSGAQYDEMDFDVFEAFDGAAIAPDLGSLPGSAGE